MVMDALADPTTGSVSPLRDYGGEQTPSPSPSIMSPHLRVLVADDDPVNREVVELMLSRLDQQADLAENGLEALDALFARRYDVVLMDIQMPELDGIAATRRIRSELGEARQPEIVAMTAGVTAEDRTRYRQAGMDAVLAKPLQLSELAAALEPSPRRHPGLDPGPEPATEPWTGGNSAFDDAGMHAVYDRSALDLLLAELGEEGDALRQDLIETYLSGDGPRFEAIEAAGRDLSGSRLGALAHELKSSSATLGLMALCDVASRIDAELRLTPQSIDVAVCAAALLRECRRASAVLAIIPRSDR
jgi:CheY-like chemotaxis protein